MSNSYVNQQFQAPQGLQPAIPFERPPQQTRTPLRTRVETPIHPPQVPPHRPAQPSPAQQQQIPQAQQQIPQAQQQLQHQQAHLDEHFRQAEQAYLANYQLKTKPPRPVYHTIDPTKTTLNGETPYVVYRPPPQQPSETASPAQLQQQQQQGDLRFLQPQPPATAQEQTHAQAQEHQAGDPQDESMQDDESSGDEEGDENTNEADGDKNKKGPAPLVQPITPLQYPAVRPTLLLGPYETREEAQTAAIEYGIAQGYMLVQSGCARAKTAWGGYDSVRPIVRIDLMCDRSGTCKNAGTGKRKRATHKIGCPTRIKVVCRKRDGCKWFIDPRCELHNHDLNLGNMESIASYRRYLRIKAGGPSAESRRDRSERRKRGLNGEMPPAPVPPPTFHTAGPLPPTEPTGPVHMAAKKGQVKILEILLNKGADIDAHDTTGRTALHCAIEGGRMDTFQLLIERGANVSRCDSKGLSPLRLAVERGLEDAVVVLIEKGADPNK